MTSIFWNKLCEFILNKDDIKLENKKEEKIGLEIKFDGNSSNRFHGIINYLNNKEGGNSCQKGIIDVTASSINYNNPSDLVDLDNNIFFQTFDEENQWVKYDFKEIRVQPTHYSIRTRTDCDGGNPQNWVIEGSYSNQENDWKILDTRQNETKIQKANSSATFNITTQLNSNENYRYLRLRQTGFSTNDSNFLTLTALEFFGTIVEK